MAGEAAVAGAVSALATALEQGTAAAAVLADAAAVLAQAAAAREPAAISRAAETEAERAMALGLQQEALRQGVEGLADALDLPSDRGLSALVAHLLANGHPAEAAALGAARRRYAAAIAAAQQRCATSSALVRQGLAFSTFVLRALTGAPAGPGTYRADGQPALAPRRSFIDAAG